MMLTNGSAAIDVGGGFTTNVWGLEESHHLKLCLFVCFAKKRTLCDKF